MKKTIESIRAFFKRPRHINPKFVEGDLTLQIIDDETEFFHAALGISDERAREIQGAIVKAFDREGSNEITLLIEVSAMCKRRNELAFAACSANRYVEIRENPFAAFISSLRPR